MNRFDKDLSTSAEREIFTTIICIVIILFFTVSGLFGPFAGLIPAVPLLFYIGYIWYNFYCRMCVTVIRIYDGQISIRWRNRMGEEMEASRPTSDLYYQYGETAGRKFYARKTLSLIETSRSNYFHKTYFMELIEDGDGWEREDFYELEAAFRAEGIEPKG
ncbi:hypothetical protein ACE38W_03635 [Chitinophaga sp. Hz27]|uniref:hypothetical protein n=1 Tax=Chitinophaga sp. Hz27 TaxID=3347169 RepID=UPI0035E1A20B